jgi:protein TonB
MSASISRPAPKISPMPATRRFGIATGSSLLVHALVLVLVGLSASRAPLPSQLLIPIELTVQERSGQTLSLGGGGQPTAAPKPAPSSRPPEPAKGAPSSKGGKARAAPAAPRVLTSRKGEEPSGPTGAGQEKAGPGGQQSTSGGPSRGPGILGGGLPTYPKNALDRGLEGTVVLSVEVDEKGVVGSVTVTKSSGHELLDAAAIRAVKQGWAFAPALKEGLPAAGTISVTFEFSDAAVKRG